MDEDTNEPQDLESAALGALNELCVERFEYLTKAERERVLNYLQWRYVRDYTDPPEANET